MIFRYVRYIYIEINTLSEEAGCILVPAYNKQIWYKQYFRTTTCISITKIRDAKLNIRRANASYYSINLALPRC